MDAARFAASTALRRSAAGQEAARSAARTGTLSYCERFSKPWMAFHGCGIGFQSCLGLDRIGILSHSQAPSRNTIRGLGRCSMGLKEYRAKRDFKKTPEPAPKS